MTRFLCLLMLWLRPIAWAQDMVKGPPNPQQSRSKLATGSPAELKSPVKDLVMGEAAMNAGEFRLAEISFRRALLLTGIDDEEGRRIQALIRSAVKAQSQMSQLTEIERMISDDELEAASQRVLVLSKDAENGLILRRIGEARARIGPTWKTQVSAWIRTLGHRLILVAGWATLAGILILLIAMLRRAHAFWRQNSLSGDHWRLGEMVDSTDLGIGNMVGYHFAASRGSKEPTSFTAGLMNLAALMIPTSPGFALSEVQEGLLQQLQDSSLTLSGVNVGAAAGVLRSLGNWWKASDNVISGEAFIGSNKQLTVRLTARRTTGKPITVEAFASCDESGAARLVVEGATFRMLYAIEHDGDVEGAEGADQLREGLVKLRTYVNGGDSAHDPFEGLRASVEAFAGVRAMWPGLLEAHLYEGIALDLLELHTEAIEHFKYVQENSDDPKLKQKALYSEAVAHLRSLYRPKGISRCIELVDKLVGPGGPDTLKMALLSDPIKGLALGLKADAIAHRPIHWKELGCPLEELIKQSFREVTQITDLLDEISKTIRGNTATIWDRQTFRQLDWSVQNALGDLNLNCAASLHFSDSAKDSSQYIPDALKALNRCAVLLPPGVETLSNLGTAYLVSEDTQEARRYLNKVIQLNRYYEYAYYRLAQTWEHDKRPEKVAAVLNKFPGPPQIPEFIEFFGKYNVRARD